MSTRPTETAAASRIPMISGDEVDALSAKNHYIWRAGMRSRIKRNYRRRFRSIVRVALRKEDVLDD